MERSGCFLDDFALGMKIVMEFDLIVSFEFGHGFFLKVLLLIFTGPSRTVFIVFLGRNDNKKNKCFST